MLLKRCLCHRIMTSIKTFVAFDTETTGLPQQEHLRTKITELSLVAVSRESITNTPSGMPRITHKITVCINPFKMINPIASSISGLTNEMLESEQIFDTDLCDIICLFLKRLTPPICLIAHNGMRFDFPILKAHLDSMGKTLPEGVLCVDSLTAFRKLCENVSLKHTNIYKQDLCNQGQGVTQATGDLSPERKHLMQEVNEKTPEKNELGGKPFQNMATAKARRRLFSQEIKSLKSFKLKDVYEFLTGKEAIDNHRAENDALLIIECMTILGSDFIEWVDKNAVSFGNIQKHGVRVQ